MTEPTTNDDKTLGQLWSRRDVIFRVSAMLGGTALVGQAAMLTGCERAATPPAETDAGRFTAADIELLSEIADTILPDTDTPGAKAAGVGPFIALMVTDTYGDNEQRLFYGGLRAVEEQCRDAYGAAFQSVTAEQRLALVQRLDQEQFDAMRKRRAGDPTHHFRMLKELTLLGYFTSEIGYTQVMRYAETPGRYDPCAELEPGDTIWATHA